MSGVNVNIDGMMVIAGLAVVAGLVVYAQKEKLLTAVNPASRDNVVNKAASSAVKDLSDGQYESVGDWVYETRSYNPIAWVNEGIMAIID